MQIFLNLASLVERVQRVRDRADRVTRTSKNLNMEVRCYRTYSRKMQVQVPELY